MAAGNSSKPIKCLVSLGKHRRSSILTEKNVRPSFSTMPTETFCH